MARSHSRSRSIRERTPTASVSRAIPGSYAQNATFFHQNANPAIVAPRPDGGIRDGRPGPIESAAQPAAHRVRTASFRAPGEEAAPMSRVETHSGDKTVHNVHVMRRAETTDRRILAQSEHVRTTRYFEEQVLRKRPCLHRDRCFAVIADPLRREEQEDGRFRFRGEVKTARRRYGPGSARRDACRWENGP